MSGIERVGPRAEGRRPLIAVCALLVMLALALGMIKGPIGKAEAISPGTHGFCLNWTLKPFGQAGDRCGAGHNHWGHINWVLITTNERAGCVNYEGWYGELYRSWACFGSSTSGYIIVPNDGGSYNGIIRNNNLSNSGRFSGSYRCCY
jgi:hypothetical protein